MLDIGIRDAKEQDAALLAALSRFVHEAHVAAHPAHFKPFDAGAIGEQFRTRLPSPTVRVFIASFGELPVGYIGVAVRERPEDARCFARRFYEIEEIAVSPEHRRQGVARALVEHVLREARAHGIDGVELTSWSFNTTAHAAFEALGFRPRVVRFRHDG